MRIHSAHQPAFFPFLGNWEKFLCCDAWVWADDMLFSKQYYHHRTKITSPYGIKWLTVKTNASMRHTFNDICVYDTSEIVNKICAWYPKNIDLLDLIREACFMWGGMSLAELNLKCINALIELGVFGEELPEIYISSSIAPIERLNATERIIFDCKTLKCDAYLSGKSGRDYLDMKLLENAGITVLFQDFQQFEYEQRYSKDVFIPGMSILDALFNNANLKSFVDRSVSLKRKLKRST